jgi:FdhE protein
MTSSSTQRLLSPEEIAVQAGQQVPFLRLPEITTVFAEREMRLRQRAADHAMRDFLLFMADVAHAQHETLQRYPAVALPDAPALAAASRAGAPPLPATLWPRDPAWRGALSTLLDTLSAKLAGSPARASVLALRNAEGDWIEQQADKLLNGVMLGLDLAAAAMSGAGLQVYWTHLVDASRRVGDAQGTPAFGRVDDATRCPCCESRPTASVSRIGADSSGYRYLHCSLCSTQWHLVRIKCARCAQTKGIHYQSLKLADDAPGGSMESPSGAGKAAVEAETCDECGHYLKIVHMERDAHVEPVADDLASVTLDLLVSEAGFERHGIDLMLLFGDPDADDGGT